MGSSPPGLEAGLLHVPAANGARFDARCQVPEHQVTSVPVREGQHTAIRRNRVCICVVAEHASRDGHQSVACRSHGGLSRSCLQGDPGLVRIVRRAVAKSAAPRVALPGSDCADAELRFRGVAPDQSGLQPPPARTARPRDSGCGRSPRAAARARTAPADSPAEDEHRRGDARRKHEHESGCCPYLISVFLSCRATRLKRILASAP